MTTPFWCLFVLIFLPYVLSTVGAVVRIKQFGQYDNKQPRVQIALLKGFGARVYAAQQNVWEAMPVFGLAVIVAHLVGADSDKSAMAAVTFIVMRVLHGAAYLANQGIIRSLAFCGAYGCCIWLFILAASV